MTQSQRKPKSWRRRLTKLLIAGSVLVFLALAVPWSPPGVRGIVERSLERRLGCDVEIARLNVWVLAGRLSLRELRLDYSSRADRFHFAPIEEPVWQLDAAEIAFRPIHLISGEHPRPLRIIMHNPDPIFVRAIKDSPDLFPPFHDLPRREPPTKKSRRWRVASLSLAGAELEILRADANNPEPKRHAFKTLHLDYKKDSETAQHQVTLSGHSADLNGPPFEAKLAGLDDLWMVWLGVGPIRFGGTDRSSGRSANAIAGVNLQGQIRQRAGPAWDLRVTANCPRFEVLGAIEEETSATLSATIDGQTSHGAIALSVGSRESRIDVISEVAFDGSRDSQSTLTIRQLAPDWLRLWKEWSPSQYPTVEGGPGRLTVSGTARLLDKAPWFEHPRGGIRLSGVELASDYLPLTLRDVAGEGLLSPGRVEITDCAARWGAGWVSLRGTHEGPWWGRWEGATRLDWAFALRAEDLISTLPAAAEDTMTTSALAAFRNRPLLDGDLSGTGTLTLGWAPGDPPADPTTRTLQGIVHVHDGQIVHPILPAPVTDIAGSFELSPHSLAIDSVRARMLGSTATVGATLTGKPFFWSTPTLHCTIRTEIPIGEAVRFLPENLRKTIEPAEPQGTFAAAVTLAGPVRQPFRPEDISATGTAAIRDVAFHSPFWTLAGRFHDVQARVDLAGTSIRLTTATGWIEEVPFQLKAEGDSRAGHLTAQLKSAAQMTAWQKVVPRALHRFEVGGAVSGSFELTASGPDLFKKATRLRGFTSETLASLPFDWDLQGDVYAHDVQLTFEKYPTSVTAVNGRVHLDKFKWTFEDLTSTWGKSEKCRIRGGGIIRPGSWPAMHVELDAPMLYLDEWIRPWRKSSPSRFPSRASNPVFNMTGIVRGERAVYRGHPGTDFYGEMDLVSPRRGVDVFRYHDTHVNLYGGRLSAEGRIEVFRGKTTSTLQLVADTISLPPFLQCETGREQTFVGRLNGEGNFEWGYGGKLPLIGHGNILITESKFWGNVFFRNLGQLIKIPLLDDVSFATIKAPFRLADRKVTCEPLVMDGSLISMTGQGVVGLDHSLDFTLELGFPRLPDYAWLLDLVMQSFGKVPSAVFSLDLRGTWDNPQFSFHQLGTAEKALLNALERVWKTVAPTAPKETPPTDPNPPR